MSSETRTSSRNTSLKLAPPVICRMGRTVTPGASSFTMNAVMPACLAPVESLRQMAKPQSANTAEEVHTFCPDNTHISPSRVALVETFAKSLPAPGSENNWQQNSSQRKKLRTHIAFCASVPHFSTVTGMRCRVTSNNSVRRGTLNCASSASATNAKSFGALRPPYSTGHDTML